MDTQQLCARLEDLHHQSYAWALQCCSRKPAQAEEVLQTVYLKILEGKARFHGRSAFRTWIFSVIRKTAADERRRNVLRKLRFVAFNDDAESNTREEDIEEAMERDELQAFFRHALAALPRRQRETLQLVFYHELSLADAAVVMGISVGSARTHYERGKRRLRQWIRPEEFGRRLPTGLATNQAVDDSSRIQTSEVFNESRSRRNLSERVIPTAEAGR